MSVNSSRGRIQGHVTTNVSPEQTSDLEDRHRQHPCVHQLHDHGQGPNAPTPSELFSAPDKNGAEAFARYFIEVVEYTWRTGNSELLRSTSHADCKWASTLLTQLMPAPKPEDGSKTHESLSDASKTLPPSPIIRATGISSWTLAKTPTFVTTETQSMRFR